MATVAQWYQRARDCHERAEFAATEADQAKWRKLAEAWQLVAEHGVLMPPLTIPTPDGTRAL